MLSSNPSCYKSAGIGSCFMGVTPESEEVPSKGLGVLWILLAAAGVVGLVVLGGIWISGSSIVDPPIKNKAPKQEILATIQEILGKSTDLTTCRDARIRLNQYLQDESKRIPATTEEQNKFFLEQIHLDEEEMKEVQSRLFTPLDDNYLDLCFLMRDAAQSLELDDLPQSEQARNAFAWVVRQLSVRETTAPGGADAPPFVLPPQFVLRRGWGSALERGLVFLELIRQLSLEGCLIAQPGKALNPWCCGVLVKDGPKESILLFDHRLGLPIPGSDGKGIATLELGQTKPEILKQITVDPKFPYDVTQKDAISSEIYLAPTLSAIAPRMGVLQDEFLGSIIRVSLGVTPSLSQARWQKALANKTPVKFAHELLGVSRRFLPPEEGGIDKSKKILPFVLLSSTQALATPAFLSELPSIMANDYNMRYRSRFIQLFQESGHPRDDVLRGRLTRATDSLVKEMDQAKDAKQSYLSQKDEVDGFLKEWRPHFVEAKARTVEFPQDPEARENFNTIRKEGEKVLGVLFNGEAAEPMLAEATYQMGLCMQETAERRQARVERPAKSEKPSEKELARANEAWATALTWWQSYIDKFDAAPMLPWARLHKARCLEALGDKDKARSILQNVGEPVSASEQVACRYRAKNLK
jgi:hypothetical protein